MKFLKIVSLCVLAFTLLAGCAGKPILNVEQAAVNYDLPENKVKQAIIDAAINRGWLVSELENGVLRGELNVRAHHAVIHISYNTKNYSIKYSNSMNLDEKNGKIHKSYNRWVMNLHQDIQLRLNQYHLETLN